MTKFKNSEVIHMKKEIRTVVYDDELRMEAYRFEGIVQPFPSHFHEHYVIGFVEKGERVTRPRQNRHLKRKDSIRFLVFLTFSSIQADRRIFSAPVMAVWLFIQKQLCCFRICLMLPVVFLRRQIAVCFVDTLPVIKYPYILEHCGFGFLPCPEMLPVEPFLL